MLFSSPRLRSAVAVLLSAVLLSGCAFRSHIDRGAAQVKTGDYRGALAAYERALELDAESEEAQRLKKQVLPYAIKQAEAQVQSALDDGDYETAVKHADYIRERSKARGRAMRERIGQHMLTALDETISKKPPRVSYELVATIERLMPGLDGIERRIGVLNDRQFAESDSALRNKQFENALLPLGMVFEFRRERRADVTKRRSNIRNAWADDVATNAKRAEAEKHPGVATTLYARAYEIAKRPEDLAALRRIRPELARQAAFTLAVTKGASDELERRLESSALELSAVRLPGEGDAATMLVELQPTAMDCDELTRTTMASTDYVAGHRYVDNPAWDRKDRDVLYARRDVARKTSSLHNAEEEHVKKRRTWRRCKRRHVEPAIDAEKSAQLKVKLAQQRVRDLEDLLKSAPKHHKRTRYPKKRKRRYERAKKTPRRIKLERRLKDAKEQLRQARRTADQRRHEREGAQRRCGSQKWQAHRAGTARQRALSELDAANRRLEEKKWARDRTPRQLRQDIIKTFRYPVTEVTRRCRRSNELKMKRAWRSGVDVKRYESVATSRDTTHKAYPEYGVDGDPLTIPYAYKQLADQVDRDLTKKHLSSVAANVVDFYKFMAGRALELKRQDPDMATDIMVSLLIVGKQHLPAADRRRFASHLTSRHGLKNVRGLTL